MLNLKIIIEYLLNFKSLETFINNHNKKSQFVKFE